MSYNSIESAKALVGVDLSQELLDEAQALIHQVTEYRWETITATETYSTRDFRTAYAPPSNPSYSGLPRERLYSSKVLFIKMPVITISSFTVDDEDMTEGTHYDLKEDIGEIAIIYFPSTGTASLAGLGDIAITYTYGYGSSHKFFPLVRGIEARIALLLQCNPLLLASIDLKGDRTVFSGGLGSPLEKLLERVPKLYHVRRAFT